MTVTGVSGVICFPARSLSILLLLCASVAVLPSTPLHAQSVAMLNGADRSAVPSDRADSIVSPDRIDPMLLPMPGDVLTPDVRGNTPNLKIAIKLGFNRSAYSNDRFPDNRPFDVGNVFGEEDVYGSAAGFGLQGGIEVEIPRSTIFSWTVGARFDHVRFDAGGLVGGDVCRNIDGDSIGNVADHSFAGEIDFLKIVGGIKLNFRTFYLTTGLTASIALTDQMSFDRTSNGERCFYPEPSDIRNSRIPVEIPEMTPLHIAFRLGGGMTFDLTESLQFSPELTLDFGQNALNKAPESDLGVYGVSGVLRVDL